MAGETAEARAGEAEARVRAKVALVAQAEEAKKLAENEAREATAKWRDLSAKEHVRNEDAIRATDAAVGVVFLFLLPHMSKILKRYSRINDTL